MVFNNEITLLRELLSLSQEELASQLDVAFETINRWESGKNEIEDRNIKKIYSYAYSKKIYFNLIFEEFLKEEHNSKNNIVLFHGAKTNISFPISLDYSKENNDFGKGFYLGETFTQAANYIANYKKSELYAFKLTTDKLKINNFNVNQEWMIAIAYYRGWLDEYENSSMILRIKEKVAKSDVIIAPIADNRMFDILSEFVRGEITNEQCQHALSATNLGMQYVLRTNKAITNLALLKKFYISDEEKRDCAQKRIDMALSSVNKIKAARIEYKQKGKYIDELLK